MTTYFLVANEKVSNEEILGRRSRARNHDGVEVTFIDEGQQRHPPSTRGGTPLVPRNVMYSGNSEYIFHFI